MKNKTKEQSSINLASELLDYVYNTCSEGRWNCYTMETLEDILNVSIRKKYSYPTLVSSVKSAVSEARENISYQDEEDLKYLRRLEDMLS